MSTRAATANPFKALRPYGRSDRGIFFGRDRDLCLVLDRVLSSRTTLIFAGSGVGKTSFLNAKLIPELDGDFLVSRHDHWPAAEPLDAVFDTVLRGAASRNGRSPAEQPSSLVGLYRAIGAKRSVLVLDQFEEVFQYHRDTHYFDRFVDAVAELITKSEADVRVVLSMREEFLGELSVFDNKIPDLFNNYYRLKNPTGGQARDIIQLTCDAAGVSCHPDNLSSLLEELLTVQAPLTQSRGGPRLHGARQRRRDHVPPPYLQITCHRLWSGQFDASVGDRAEPFLARYQEGDAARELSGYCHETLKGLTPRERDLACDAFGFLMTRQGSKMAYELSALAEHMKVEEAALRETLATLSQADVRILRQSSGPDGSTWFELYHDMYAPFLVEWTAAYSAERRRKEAEEEAGRRDEAVRKEVAIFRSLVKACVVSTLVLPLAPLVLPFLLKRLLPQTSWPTALLAGLGWVLGWLAASIGATLVVDLTYGFERALPADFIVAVATAFILGGGPLGAGLAYFVAAPRATQFGWRRAMWTYAPVVSAALLTNASYALSPAVSINLAVMVPIIILLTAARFGPLAAATVGALVPSLAVVLRLPASLASAQPADIIFGSLHRGPLYIPFSSVADIIHLGLLGYCAGWIVERWREDCAGDLLRRIVPFRLAMLLQPRRYPVLWAMLGVSVAILANVGIQVHPRSSAAPWGTMVPERGMAQLIVALTGFMLGAGVGTATGAVTGLASFVLLILLGSSTVLRVDYAQFSEIASLVMFGYLGGRLAAVLQGALAKESQTVAHVAEADRPGIAGQQAATPILLLLCSCLLVSVDGDRRTSFVVGLQSIGPFAAVLAGVWCGPVAGAKLTLFTVAGMALLVAPLSRYLGWPPPLAAFGLELGLHTVQWSALAVVVMAAGAWAAGRARTATDRRERLLVLFGLVAALEMLTVLATGTFPFPYVRGELAGWRLDLVGTGLRAVELWIVIVLLDVICERLADPPSADPAHRL